MSPVVIKNSENVEDKKFKPKRSLLELVNQQIFNSSFIQEGWINGHSNAFIRERKTGKTIDMIKTMLNMFYSSFQKQSTLYFGKS